MNTTTTRRPRAVLTLLALALCVTLTVLSSGASAEMTFEEKWAALTQQYEEKAAVQEYIETQKAAVSDDQMVLDGNWTELARKYDNEYTAGDAASAPSPARLASWWNSLGDQTLTDLIYQALQNNKDLTSARARVTEARAALGISKAALLPWLDNVDSWTYADPTKNGANPGGNSNTYRLGIDASWEIDIFGGQRANVRAGEADLAATYAALHNSWVTLSSEVALNYLTLCTLHERLRIADQNLALQTNTLEMLQSQYDSGLTDALALSQAQYTVEQTKASIPPIKASIEESMNALAILTGAVPGSLEELLSVSKPIPKPDPVNLVGIPAETLRRRPDIRAAEMELVAQVARKESAKADIYPKLHLLGSIGLESISTGSLFSSDSYGFSIGPRISWPIFHGGAIRKNIQVQTAREEQYLAAYEQTVLNAVAEVRNALTANTQERDRNNSLVKGVEAARVAVEVAEDKYRNGLSDFNNVITAQQALLSLQDQFVISEGQMTSNIVQIFKALGGGWEPLAEENRVAAETK